MEYNSTSAGKDAPCQTNVHKARLVFKLVVMVSWVVLLLPVYPFLTHRSQNPTVLHRYSTGYMALLTIYFSILLLWPLLLRLPDQYLNRLSQRIEYMRSRPGLRVPFLVTCISLTLLALVITRQWDWGRNNVVQLAIVLLGSLVGFLPTLWDWGLGWKVLPADHTIFLRWLRHVSLAASSVLVCGLAIGFLEHSQWKFRGVLELVVVIAAISLFCFVVTWGQKAHKRREYLVNIAIAFVSLLIGAAFVEGAFRFLPDQIPDDVRRRLPYSGEYLRRDVVFDKPIQIGRKFVPLQDAWIEGKPSEIVLFNGRERFLQLRETDIETVRVHFVTDENGFRNPPPLAPSYDIVVGGDSFTVGVEVQAPWPTLLEQYTDLEVLSLAVPGAGPQAEAEAVKAYGLPKTPNVVIIAYFEGNDLRDTVLYERARNQLVSLREAYLSEASWDRSLVVLTWLRVLAADFVQGMGLAHESAAQNESVAIYPVEAMLNGKRLRLSFLDGYVSMLTAHRTDIKASQNYRLATASLLDVKHASERIGARFLLVYIPSKAHVYLPLMKHGVVEQVTKTIPKVELSDGVLVFDSSTIGLSAQDFLAHIHDQIQVLREFAADRDIEFIDLTPHFQAEAERGEELYFQFSTHWNNRGHQLAAEVLAQYLAQP